MSPIDIGLLIILGFFVVKGLIRGIVLEVLTLAGLVLGYLVALRQMGFAAGLIRKYLHLDDVVAGVTGFILVFMVVFILCRILAGIFRKMISKTPAGTIDKGGGALFGALKGMLVCGLIAVLIHLIPTGQRDFDEVRDKSVMLRPCYRIATGVFNAFRYLLPQTEDFTNELKEGMNARANAIKDQIMQESLKSIEERISKESDEDAKGM